MGLKLSLSFLNNLNISNIFSLMFIFVFFTGCMGESHVEVKTFGKDQSILLDPAPGIDNTITTSNFQVGTVSNSGFSLSLDFIGDSNSNSTAMLYYCNETINPGCSPELIGDSISLNKNSNQFEINLSGLTAPDYNKGDYINIVVVVSDSDGVVGERFTQTIRMISILKIYRSVGFGNTLALATGAGNGLTISDGVANFASPLADNIGVGDAIQFDSTNDGIIDSVIFISKRNSSTSYDVQTTAGGDPNNLALADEDWSIFRAYTGLSLAENGTENTALDDNIENFDTWSGGRDLVTNSEQWNIAYYADGIDNIKCQVEDWTTNEDSYFRVFVPSATDEVGISQRHLGIWDNSKAVFSVSGGSFSEDPFRIIDVAFVEIDGLQIETANEGGREGIFGSVSLTPTKLIVKNNIIRANGYAGGDDVSGIAVNTATLVAINNIIYGFTDSGIETNSGSTAYLYNNTLFGNGTGIYSNGGGDITAYNNLSAGNVVDYRGSFDTSASNISLDDTSENLDFRSRQVEFHLKERQDFRLKKSSYQAIGTAQDLSSDPIYAFNEDITGNLRTTWDIGAYNSMSENIIFRSIGPTNTSALSTGTGNNFTISLNSFGHTEAVFTNELRGHIGVGDAIQYDSTGGSTINAIAFIGERVDDYTFIVKGADGNNAQITASPSDSWSIYRAYTSFINSHQSNENASIDGVVRDFDVSGGGLDIVTRNEQWNFAVYADAVDTTGTGEFGETWITDETHYIKIFTPFRDSHAKNRQRHIGKFEEEKLNIDGVGSARGINICSDYMRIEGLTTRTENATFTISYCSSYARLASGNYTMISHNIIRGKNQPAYSRSGISCSATNSQDAYIFNNIVSDFDPTNGITTGINSNCTGNFYVYNNTSVKNGRGFSGNFSLLKNNLAFGNTTDFAGAGAPGSGYNLSGDGTAGSTAGSNDVSNATPYFKDYDYIDYRLLSTDKDAKSVGLNLKFDSSLSIHTDINNHPKGNYFDIGAHEAGNEIIRSVGPGNNNALAAGGSNGFTILNGIATFTSGLPSSIGIGDGLQYDSDNDGSIDSIVFIHYRQDNQTYVIKNINGSTPNDMAVADQDWAIYRAYTSLEDAEAGSENSSFDANVQGFDSFNGNGGRDLIRYGENWYIALYADGIDTDSVVIEDWNTGPTRELKIFTPRYMSESGARQKHEGVWNDYFYSLQPSDDNSSIVINEKFVTVEGLQISVINNSSQFRYGIALGNSTGEGVVVSENLVRNDNQFINNRSGIFINDYQVGSTVIKNNTVYKFGGANSSGILVDENSFAQFIYNNTAANNTNGISCSFQICALKNNLAVQNSNVDLPSSFLPNHGANNLSSDSTASTTGVSFIINSTPIFMDASNDDYRLSSTDGVAKNQGMNLYTDTLHPVSSDVAGHTRFDFWDIGAFEAANQIFRSVGPSNSSSLENGSGNDLTISGSIVNFSSGISDIIGVGDAIQFDRDNDGTVDDLMFISGRISNTQYNVTDVDGHPVLDMGNADQDWDIYRAYTSTFNARSGIENSNLHANIIDFDSNDYDNLYLRNVQLNLAIYSDNQGGDLNLRYFVTSPTNFIKVFAPSLVTEVGESQRHSGVWDNSKARLIQNIDSAVIYTVGGFDYQSFHIKVDGLQIENTRPTGSGGSGSGIDFFNIYYPGEFEVTNNIIRKSGGVVEVGEGGIVARGDEFSLIAANNIIYDYSNGIRTRVAGGTGAQSIFYNNTIINSPNYGVQISAYGSADEIRLKNNIIQNSGTADFFLESGAEVSEYLTNITSDATGPGGTDTLNTSLNFIMPSDDDYRLNSTDTSAINTGTDLSGDAIYPLSTDIIAANRTLWDRGAFAYEDFSALTSFSAKGSGTAEDPYELFSKAQLKNIGEDTTNGCNSSTSAGCGLHFEIMNSIDLESEAFTPIGSTSNPFSGDFDGNEYTVSNLSISLAVVDDVGFFGHICAGYIRNLRMDSISVTGQNYVGGLVGRATCAGNTISQIKIFSGEVTGEFSVGGVIGSTNELSATDILTRVNVNSLIGTAGAVLGESASGFNASLSNIYSYGNVTTTAGTHTGGFVGRFGGTGNIVDSFSVGDVLNNGATEVCTGGFAGTIETTGLVSRSWAGGDTKASYDNVGGFVGCVDAASSISNSFSMGRTQSTGAYIGGFAGTNNGTLTDNYSIGNVILTGTNDYGAGFVGNNTGTGTISESYANGNINGHTNNNYLGGFVGLNAGSISLSNAKGSVVGGAQVGGFVGVNNAGTINTSYSKGDVVGTTQVGGFVGSSYGGSSITNSYTKNAHIRGNTVGGFAGEINIATFTNNYSASIIQGNSSAYSFIHTITSGTLNDNYWDGDLSSANGSSSAASSAGEYISGTTAFFMDSANFDSSQSGVWDYTSTWTQLDERNYPIHKNSPEGNCVDNPTASSHTDIGSGTQSDPYILCNGEQFNSLESTSGDHDKYIALGADLEFHNGNPSKLDNFSGVFDGRGYALKNYQNFSVTSDQGVFGTLTGIVKNTKLENYYLDGSVGAASLVVIPNNGQILNNKVNGSINATSCCAGGLSAGFKNLKTDNYSIFYGNDFIGSINSSGATGGIIGDPGNGLHTVKNRVYSTIVATGNTAGGISGSDSYLSKKNKTFGSVTAANSVGGIFADTQLDGIIDQSYSKMDISSTVGSSNGGLGANSAAIINSYSKDAIIDGGGNTAAGLSTSGSVYHSYAFNTIQNYSNAAGIGFGSASGMTENFWSTEIATILNGRGGSTGSVANQFEGKTNAQMLLDATFANWDSNEVWLLSDTIRTPLLRWDVHPICQNNPLANQYNSIGTGTSDDPYKICFREQLEDLAVNGCGNDPDGAGGSLPITTACGADFILMNDIDLKNSSFFGIGDNELAYRFEGTFNGNNHTISNLNLSSAKFLEEKLGFFRAIGVSGVVKNLNFVLANVDNSSTYSDVGIIAGFNVGLIDNCHVDGTVSGRTGIGGVTGGSIGIIRNSSANIQATANEDYVGGIVGETSGGSISNSYAVGTVISNLATGPAYIGGLVGASNATLISNSWAEVKVNAGLAGYAGGLIGFGDGGSVVEFSYALGDVDCDYGRCGGFIGTMLDMTISNSYSRGSVGFTGTVGNYYGGFAGRANHASANLINNYSAATYVEPTAVNTHPFVSQISTGTITNNYWDNDVFSGPSDPGKFDGLTTAQMNDSTNFLTWDNNYTWSFTGSGYPTIIPLSN